MGVITGGLNPSLMCPPQSLHVSQTSVGFGSKQGNVLKRMVHPKLDIRMSDYSATTGSPLQQHRLVTIHNAPEEERMFSIHIAVRCGAYAYLLLACRDKNRQAHYFLPVMNFT